MTKYHWGAKRFEIKDGLPRLFLHEKQETVVRWILRGMTATGVVLSVISFEWYVALSLSIGAVAIDWFLERTLFYYTSMYVSDIMTEYDPDMWVATVVVSIGEPKDPKSRKILGLCMKTEEYAAMFFRHLHRWTRRDDHNQGDLRLTFVVDEDMYFVFLYSELMNSSFKKFSEATTESNRLAKYGKEHFPLIVSQIICKGFQTTKGFALGMFLDSTPPDSDFLLAPYVTGKNGAPIPSETAEPILMSNYKFRLPHELQREDLEYFHWHKIVKRRALGADA